MRGLQLSVQRPQGVQLTGGGVDADGRVFVWDGVPAGEGDNIIVPDKQKNKDNLPPSLHGQSVLPDAFFSSVGIAGSDEANAFHHALLIHSEVVGGLAEDWWLVHIQHLDDHLFVQIQNATV